MSKKKRVYYRTKELGSGMREVCVATLLLKCNVAARERCVSGKSRDSSSHVFPAVFDALSRDHVRPWSSPVKAVQCAEDAPPRPFPVAVRRAAHLKQVSQASPSTLGKRRRATLFFVRSIVVVEEAQFSLT